LTSNPKFILNKEGVVATTATTPTLDTPTPVSLEGVLIDIKNLYEWSAETF
jgi:hypothetical protein